MKNKILLFLPIVLLAAGCNIFGTSVAAGVIKSVNGGADWQFSNGAKNKQGVNLVGLDVSKIALSPANHEVVYAGGYNSGLYKSSDSGATWQQILSKILVYDFVLAANDPKTIYVAGLYGTSGKVLKTTDGGASWQEVYNDASQSNPVRAIALNPGNPSQLAIGTNSGSVIKSADGGLSWQLAKDFSDRVQRMAWQSGQLYVLLRTKGLYESSDFGGSFNSLSDSLLKTFSLGGVQISSESNQVFNQFYVDNLTANLIYVSSGLGVHKTTDGGKTWTLPALPVNPNSTNARPVAGFGGSGNIIYTAIGATIYKSTDGGQSWHTQSIATAGFINYILIDPQLQQIVYAGIYGSQ